MMLADNSQRVRFGLILARKKEQMKGKSLLFATTIAALSLLTLSANPIVTVPAGLAPGSHYQLIFVTAGTMPATSTNISDYNTFVAGQLTPALAALDTTWTAVASTNAVNAFNNAPAYAGVPVYNLDGEEVFTGSDGSYPMYGNNTEAFLNAPDWTQNGVEDQGLAVWTGSNFNGQNYTVSYFFHFGLGSTTPFGGIDGPAIGYDYYIPLTDPLYESISTADWIFGDFDISGVDHSLYALSGELTVPVPNAPEPGTLCMLIAGVSLVLVGKLGLRSRQAR